MAIEVNTDRVICTKCGISYGRRKGYFPVNYGMLYKGTGHTAVCRDCIDKMYDAYLSQCEDPGRAVRQMCRKLDLYWDEKLFNQTYSKTSPRTVMTQYMAKLTGASYAGKSYDDTLSKEGSLWTFGEAPEEPEPAEPAATVIWDDDSDSEMPDERVIAFWGPGYTPGMYRELERRFSLWMEKFPKGVDVDIGTEAIIRQICSLELDINRDRAKGKSVDKSINALNTLLGSANLKPVQRKQEEADANLDGTPLGVWIQRFEKERPLPEVDEDCKDVNHLRKYVFIWMGHLCKMLGLKNGYEKMYEDEIARLRVEKPEYDGDDDEAFMMEVMNEERDG